MARGLRFVVAAAVLGVLALGPGSSRGVSLAPLAPQKTAIFNAPLVGTGVDVGDDNLPVPGAPSQITQSIVSLLRDVAPRAKVRVAVYYMSDNGLNVSKSDVGRIVTALNQAVSKRHADVAIVADVRYAHDRVWKRVDPHIKRYFCNGGCYGPRSTIMHNKFVTVDDTTWTSGKENVVLQMSANWSNTQLQNHQQNSMVRVWGNKRVYAGMTSYWNGMASCANHCNGYPLQGFSGRDGVYVHLYPQSSGDPALSEINAISCKQSVGSPASNIEIVMGAWDASPRGRRIAAALRAKHAQGCRVRIVIPRSLAIKPVLLGLHLPVRCGDDADPNVSVRRVTPSVHSKYMLVRGKYGGQDNMRIVFTGSQNFDEPSLHWHDETWWKFASRGSQYPENASLHRQFTANFNAIWAEALPCQFMS